MVLYLLRNAGGETRGVGGAVSMGKMGTVGAPNPNLLDGDDSSKLSSSHHVLFRRLEDFDLLPKKDESRRERSLIEGIRQ